MKLTKTCLALADVASASLVAAPPRPVHTEATTRSGPTTK